MNDYVLDASALLTLLNAEKGADVVQNLLPRTVISSVNLAEVVTRLSLLDMPENEIHEILDVLGLEIVSFNEEQSFQAGLISKLTQPLGLSLGDRACLSLALTTHKTALTADRIWKELKLGVEIQLVR